ncbi:MAG: hypothetical protein KBS95_04950 [Alistipes sp.]|nr:hypothetical protein [Candidatus Alistipes equi]
MIIKTLKSSRKCVVGSLLETFFMVYRMKCDMLVLDGSEGNGHATSREY